jgi:hypothetical protein
MSAEVEARIINAFDKSSENIEGHSWPIGTLEELAYLFPSKSAPSLHALSTLQARQRSASVIAAPAGITKLQVVLGVGKPFAVARSLHSFYNSMLEFESAELFESFIDSGYSVVVTNETDHAIVAAASFVAHSDGIFVDAIAVSTGHHENSCPLSADKFILVDDDDIQIHLLAEAKGSFQNCGLGSFLLALLSRCANWLCKDSPAVYLKANKSHQNFYTNRGFHPVSTGSTLPKNLFEVVPPEHFETSPATLLLVQIAETPTTTDDPAVPADSQDIYVATQLASLKATSPTTTTNKSEEPPNLKTTSTSTMSQQSTEPPKMQTDEVLNSSETEVEDETVSKKGSINTRKARLRWPMTAVLDSSGTEDEDESVTKRSPTNTRKARSKSKKHRQALAKADEQLTVATSDSEDAPGDYDNYLVAPPVTSWTLPHNDFWGPQSQVYQQFRAKEPQVSHQLSQKEIIAKHGATQCLALSRIKVILKAQGFQSFTMSRRASKDPTYKKKYTCNFTKQEYLDLAAVADLNRSIKIYNDRIRDNHDEVTVSVSSYIMPEEIEFAGLLSNRKARRALKPSLRDVTVSLPWLVDHSRPEVATLIDDSILGSKVQRVRGSNFGTDALTMSFSGSMERDKKFLPLPQGHVATYFCPAPHGGGKVEKRLTIRQQLGGGSRGLRTIPPSASIAYYNVQGNPTEKLQTLLKREAKKHDIQYAPPPPKVDTQVVKLKWVPTRLRGKNPKEHGIWRGGVFLQSGTDKSTRFLQECGLLRDFVEREFSYPLRMQCKAIATRGSDGKRNPKSFIFIPAGDVHDACADPPPFTELISHVPVIYLQGAEDSCLRHSMASALAAMGFSIEAKVLSDDTSLVGATVELVQRVSVVVQKLFVSSNLALKKIHNHACSVSDISTEDSSWPIILLLQTSDGCHGRHAITTWKGMIFDSNCAHALKWSQKSLDWCSGVDSACTGFSRAYRICPADMGQTVGLHVPQRDGVIGWIMKRPSKRQKRYHVRFADGVIEKMSEGEAMEKSLVYSSTVGGLKVVDIGG